MQWRTGDRRITDEHLMEVIELAREDPALAVLVRQEMAKTKAEKKAWGALWDRLSAAAAVLVLVVVAMPGVARAKAIEIKGLGEGNAAVCILCSKRSKGLPRFLPLSVSLIDGICVWVAPLLEPQGILEVPSPSTDNNQGQFAPYSCHSPGSQPGDH